MAPNSAISHLDPLSCSLLIISAFVLAGILQTVWFKSPLSARLAIPLDGGKTFRSQPIFGENKTVRGFVVMVPAAGLAFFVLAQLLPVLPFNLASGTWKMSSAGYGLLGLGAGFGFMIGELPNSFLKRRFEIPPGGRPGNPLVKPLFFLVDRLDSIVGMLLVVSLMVPTTWHIWFLVLLVGGGIHWCFSLVLFLLGAKDQPA